MMTALPVGELFQVGIVVPDLRKSLDLYSRQFGLGPWIGFHFTPDSVKDFTYRGRPADYSIEIAITGTGPQIELVQVHGEHSLYHEWIERHGYGIQHFGARVPDMAAATETMTKQGYEIVQSGHGYGAEGDGAFTYFDTLDDFGFILELIQVPRTRREPDFVWPPAD